MSASPLYGNRDPRDIPAYPRNEAARYAGVTFSTLRRWLGERGDPPIIRRPPESEQLSFYNLIEAFVLGALRQRHNIPLQQIRRDMAALDRLYPDIAHPLVEIDLSTRGRQVFAYSSDYLTNLSRGGQLAIAEVLRPYLERVEKSPQGVVRLFPLTRTDPAKSPRLIAIDPRVAFGRPVIAGTGIPTSIIHERWKAGDSVTALAEDYNRTTDEIEEALRYEAA